jgi:hypothetical protein
LPEYPITLRPNWLRQLGWQAQDDEFSVYVDTDSVVVAKLTSWRDAGPVDIEDDAMWGEGSYLTLTEAGLGQFKAVQEDIIIRGFAIREVQMAREDGRKIVETAVHTDSL